MHAVAPIVADHVPGWQIVQAAVSSSVENVPGSHAEHDLSPVAVPLVVAYFPAVQVSHFEQPAWLDPDAKVPEPHGEHARSELRDPAALTKVPPPQTVQGAHELGGRLDSDTVKVPL